MSKSTHPEAPPRIHWRETEWYDVTREAVPIRDRTAKGWEYCIDAAQKKVLPKIRQRPIHSSIVAQARDYEARYRAGWVPEGRLTDPATPEIERKPEGSQKDRDAAREATFTGYKVFWTAREWAMMACAVKWRIEHGDTRGLPRIFFETQADILPLDRCKRLGSLAALAPLQKAFDEAVPNIWTLPPDIRAKCEQRGPEYEAQQAKTQAGIIVAPPPAPGPMPETLSAPLPEAAPFPAFLAAAAEGDPLAVRLGMIIANAASQVAQETRAHVMAEYDRQLDRLTASLHATLRDYVHTLVTAELGPLSTPPGAAPAAPSTNGAPPVPEAPPTDTAQGLPAPAVQAEPPPRVRVDVVGMERIGTMQVRSAAEKLGLDLRLIDSDQGKTSWIPRENVILATQYIPHHITRIAKKAGSNVMFANAGPASVLGMLESLAEHRGNVQ